MINVGYVRSDFRLHSRLPKCLILIAVSNDFADACTEYYVRIKGKIVALWLDIDAHFSSGQAWYYY